MGVGQKSVGVFLGFIRIELRKCDAGMVVTCDKQDLPAGTAGPIAPVARGAMSRVLNAAKLRA